MATYYSDFYKHIIDTPESVNIFLYSIKEKTNKN